MLCCGDMPHREFEATVEVWHPGVGKASSWSSVSVGTTR
jgi:hypothetical protein